MSIVLKKIFRRTLYALTVCSSGLLFCLSVGGNTWLLLPLHLGVGAWSIWLGIRNPIHAAAEEGLVCVLLCLGLISYPFVTTIGG